MSVFGKFDGHRLDPDRLISDWDERQTRLPPDGPLAPTGRGRKINLDYSLATLSAQEATLLAFLKPSVGNRFVLAPGTYQMLLESARLALAAEAAAGDDDRRRGEALNAAARLIGNEQELLALLSVQRHLLVGA